MLLSAHGASKCEFDTGRRMLHFYLAACTRALWQFIDWHSGDGVGFVVARLTHVAVVVAAPPDGGTAAVLAFPDNIIGSVVLAVLHATANDMRHAPGAEHLFLVQTVLIEGCTGCALLSTHEVGILAREALIIRQDVHGVGEQVAAVYVATTIKLFILLNLVVVSSLLGFFLDVLFEFVLLVEHLGKLS